MRVWNKYSEIQPHSEVLSMWLWDGKEVCWGPNGIVCHSGNGFTHWMEREVSPPRPEPPEKERHRCDEPNGHPLCCLESDDGLYMHYLSNYGQRYMTKAISCPFCGFTLGNK
jgi:hypothetical protein